MATAPTDQAVADFLASVPDEQRRADAHELVTLMREVTGEPPVMWGASIIGFGRYHYRYASGHEGDSALACFSPRKQHLVLYLVGGFDDRYAKLMPKLGPHKTGKGCLYIKRLADVDMKVLRELVELSAKVREDVDQAGS